MLGEARLRSFSEGPHVSTVVTGRSSQGEILRQGTFFILILGAPGYGLITDGMSARVRAKPLVGEAITTILFT
jgi:hypothetical protein